MADIDLEALVAALRCSKSFAKSDMLWIIAMLAADSRDALETLVGSGTTIVTQTLSMGTGAIPAGLQDVEVQLLAPFYDGSNEVTATVGGFTLSNNPEEGRMSLSLSATDRFGVNARLPAMAVVGDVQWVALSNP